MRETKRAWTGEHQEKDNEKEVIREVAKPSQQHHLKQDIVVNVHPPRFELNTDNQYTDISFLILELLHS